MAGSVGPEARMAFDVLPMRPWRGTTWRIHAQRYAATDPGGSRRFSGRYHRAPDLFSNQRTWAALYLALDTGSCLAEAVRHATELSELANRRISEIAVSLFAVIDLRNAALPGITTDDLVDDRNYALTQEIGLAALERGAEGLLVPAASLIGDNLVVLVNQVRQDSELAVRGYRDPRLLMNRPGGHRDVRRA
jgi:RES domain-containing protein